MGSLDSSHAGKNQKAFEAQAPTFDDPTLNGALTDGLGSLVAAIEPNADQLCLDVAAGTGQVACALAPSVRTVVALDAVEEMLAQAIKKAQAANLRNVVLQRGEALALPFVDDVFDVVVTRFSLHHLTDPAAAVAEMVRVCRPGGRVVIADLTHEGNMPGPDAIERLRDASHLRVLSREEIATTLTEAGATIIRSEVETHERPLGPWLEQAHTPSKVAEQIREYIYEELSGGPPTGMQPSRRDDELHFVQLWATVVARCGRRRTAQLNEVASIGAHREESK